MNKVGACILQHDTLSHLQKVRSNHVNTSQGRIRRCSLGLVLVLAFFFSTGVASAHGTQAAHSQASLTSLSTLTVDQCSQVYVAPGGSYAGRYFASGGYVTVCGRYDYYNGYYGNYSPCSKVYAPSGYYRGIYFTSAGYVTFCGSSSTCK